jgi:membrane-bound lytic murein transglycosylase B
LRCFLRLALMTLLTLCAAPAIAQEIAKDPKPFLEAIWKDASARGIKRETFDAALAGFTADPRVSALTGRQAEYGLPAGTYINRAISGSRIEGGTNRIAEWSQSLDRIEKQYGVDRAIIVALWGMETSFGANTGGFDVIRSLATLALIGYRPDYFTGELLTALQILQEGHIARDKMQGSWAGAMGQPQFMPSSFMRFAVDFTGDGHKDIWTSVPDTLASIANYMKSAGWTAGLDWHYEVLIPASFDYRRSRAEFPEWTKLGVTRADGEPLPAEGDAILFFPSGAAGPAFLVTRNFQTIKRYNNSDVYALAVGHLAHRFRSRAPIRTAWPADDRQLTRTERIALQKRLKELGHPVNDFAGRIDFDLRDVIRLEQAKHAMVPDGHPTLELLKKIGAAN